MYTNDLGFDRTETRSGAITRYMRMCICLARLTVGSPAGMSDTTGSFQCLTAICLFDQIGQTPLCFHDLCQILSITDSQSSRIISSIFQFRQTIQQDRCCQLTHRLLLNQHDFHRFQAGQNAIASARILGEDDMAALLTADTAAVLGHILINILIADSGLA